MKSGRKEHMTDLQYRHARALAIRPESNPSIRKGAALVSPCFFLSLSILSSLRNTRSKLLPTPESPAGVTYFSSRTRLLPTLLTLLNHMFTVAFAAIRSKTPKMVFKKDRRRRSKKLRMILRIVCDCYQKKITYDNRKMWKRYDDLQKKSLNK